MTLDHKLKKTKSICDKRKDDQNQLTNLEAMNNRWAITGIEMSVCSCEKVYSSILHCCNLLLTILNSYVNYVTRKSKNKVNTRALV